MAYEIMGLVSKICRNAVCDDPGGILLLVH